MPHMTSPINILATSCRPERLLGGLKEVDESRFAIGRIDKLIKWFM
jgi:hypothetical protein